MQEILRWITYQGLRQDKEESVDRFSWMYTGMALSWYNQYVIDKPEKERNIHDFILYFRKKVVPSIAADLRWKEWEEYKYSKLGPNASVNNHAQNCLEFYNDCLDKQGNKMINMHALKHKFVNKILTPIRVPLKMQINWDMTFEEIIVVAEKIQVLNAHDPARGITTPQGTFYYKDGKKIRQPTPKDRGRSLGFTKSNWRPGQKYTPAGPHLQKRISLRKNNLLLDNNKISLNNLGKWIIKKKID